MYEALNEFVNRR